MKYILAVILTILLVGLSVGGCKLERYIHYKYSYQYMVTEQMKPLADKVSSLERRIEQLEKNK